MNLLQQAFTVEIDSKKLMPSITQFNNKTFVQYDIGDEHIRFELDEDDLEMPLTYDAIKQHVKYWAVK